ncbi:MAG: hypothetical protein BRD45_01345 [Bacteroidetes bacterium QS_8_64_10]|nr:MAG: hypothetical protein BRD45_01345 [Bacteroidetes bacterium QS_8_64_10]
MRIDVVTALPGLVEGPLRHSILKRAAQKGLADVRVHDLRDYGAGKHREIDDYPYGGGAGMVLKPEPIFACIEDIKENDEPDEVPASLVLCFHDGVLDHVAESYAVSGVSSKRLPRTLDVAVVRPATGIAHPVE